MESPLFKNRLYGAWITPQGDFIPVDSPTCHFEVFVNVVLKGKEPKRYYYSLAYRLGYIRLTFVDDTSYILEGSKIEKTTKSQKTWIQNCKEFTLGRLDKNKKVMTFEECLNFAR